jgi:F-type H+-transporting ATPase subunit a
MIRLPCMLAVDPVEHVIDKALIKGNVAGHEMWWLSNATVMLVLGAAITAILVIPAARRVAANSRKPQRTIDDFRPQGTLGNLVEAVCVYLRDEVFRGVLGEETDRFTPILWTFFWFILVCNLMGLVPLADLTGMFGINHGHGIGGTATQSIWVTAALAGVSFVFYNLTAFIRSPLGYLKHLTAGAPMFMWPIMVIVEIIGTFIKPFALAIRLCANMTGGHLAIAVFLSFVPAMIKALGPAGYGLALLPMIGAVAINMLELLVAFIQAYIFTFLSCLFLAQLVVHDEEGHHEHSAENQDQTHRSAPEPAVKPAS